MRQNIVATSYRDGAMIICATRELIWIEGQLTVQWDSDGSGRPEGEVQGAEQGTGRADPLSQGQVHARVDVP
jgi:hypothetical protein